MTIADGDPAVAEDVLAAIAAAGTPIVTNVAAMRGLATAPATKSIFVSGYYAAGDGGGGIFVYNSADTSTADNGGTICVDTLGHRYYRQHGSAPLNAAWFGAVGDGTTVNDAAFNNMMTVAMAQTGGAQVLFPPGKFLFSSQLTVTYPSGRPYNLELKGSGAILYWPASGGGMVFAYSEPSHILLLEGMTFTVGVANGGAGITITQSDPLLNFVNTNVRAVTFRGDDDINTGGSFYWSNGATINNVSGTNWEGCTFYGGNVSAGVYGGNGINFSGTGVGGPSGINYSIYHNIAKGIFNGLNVGIAYGSYAQGITIGQCNFQNTMTGFDAQASETGQLSQLQIFDSQFACNLNCISVLTSIGNCFIEHNDIFVTQGTTGILLNTYQGATITGNNIACASTTGTNGIFLNGTVGSEPATIIGNTITGGAFGIVLESASTNVVVVGNSIVGCTARIANNGTNNVIIDTFAGNVGIGAIVAPIGDNVFTMGTSSNRWSSVFAANGTIQTSDPNEKTDIVPISGPTALALVDKIQPITFRWKVGGHDLARNADGKRTYEARPGKRTHWGFDAAAIKQAFDATGMDFGGYVLSEDGKHSLRPDQLIPVLWQALKQISVQVDKLTADVSAMKPAESK